MASEPPANDRRAFVIDDDEVMLLSCREVLGRVGYEVETFASGAVGVERVATDRPPVLVVDLKMPGIDGLEVIRRVRARAPEVVMVVITGHATIGAAVEAMRAGAYDFLPKPFTPAELRLIIDRAHERWLLARESERLRREKEAAERRFVTFLSHQLKSPLAAVRQYLDALVHIGGADLTPLANEWIARCRARLTEMATMIDDWLTLARIERGEMSLRDASSDLRMVVLEELERAQSDAAQAGVTLAAELGPDPLPVPGDPTCLRMLVDNLVGNAIKYNRPQGSVVVRASCADREVDLEVEDTGVGIPDESIGKLFSEFYRVRTPETEKIPGTGLGLAICRRIVTDLGGRIEASSQLGSGTCIRARLPCAPAAPSEPAAAGFGRPPP